MPHSLQDLLDFAMKREIESQRIYEEVQEKTENSTAKSMLKALALEEQQHIERIRELGGTRASAKFNDTKIVEIKNSSFFDDYAFPEGAELEDVLKFAIKREQASMEFYANIMSAVEGEEAKSICEQLAHDELKHKAKLELMYDDLFYG